MYSYAHNKVFYAAFTFLCLSVVVTILLVQPYKKIYAQYNKFDAVLLILVIAFTTSSGITFDKRKITRYGTFTAASIVVIVPVFYS